MKAALVGDNSRWRVYNYRPAHHPQNDADDAQIKRGKYLPHKEDLQLGLQLQLTFTPPESSPSGQFWGIYALIGGVGLRINRLGSGHAIAFNAYIGPSNCLVCS